MTNAPPRTVVRLAGAVGALLVVLCMVFNERYHASYLYAYVFWSGVSLGSLGIVMVHHLTGGQWEHWLRRPLEAALSPLPLMALLFILAPS